MTIEKMYHMSIIFLFSISMLSLVLLFMIFFPVTVIKPNVQPYKIVGKQTIQRGEFITYQVDACKYYDLTSSVKRQLVIENVIYDLPITQNNISAGCGKTNVSVQIPMVLPSGRAHIELEIEYHVNALRDQSYQFKTGEFIITR